MPQSARRARRFHARRRHRARGRSDGPTLRAIEDLISAVPLFRALDEQARHALGEAAEWVRLAAGDYLFHQGDEPDGLAIVWTGRLQVRKRDGDGPDRVVGLLGRGSWVGELSLLTGDPRSASVRALRDSELLVISRAAFTKVLRDESDLALDIARVVARQLQQSRGVELGTDLPNTIGVIPLGDGLPVERFVTELERALAPHGPVGVLRGAEDPDRWTELLDQAEATYPIVLLVADAPADEAWRSFCTRSSDRALALLRGGAPPAWAKADGSAPLVRRDLVFVGTELNVTRTAKAMLDLQPRATHHLPENDGFAAAAARIGRRATGHALGLVLSGGGARGLAHLGVMRVLLERGVVIDRVGGCSAGAFAAGLFALQLPPDEMESTLREELVERHPFSDFTVPRESLIRGRRAMAMLTRVFGDRRIEELSIPMFAVSADLSTGDLVVHREGLAREAIAASMAIPGFAPPVRQRGTGTPPVDHWLVDGGLLDNFPIDVMEGMLEGPVIGVDVMRDYPDGFTPGIVATLARSMVLGGWRRAEQNRQDADLLIAPDVADIGMFDFDRIDDAIEAGRRAATTALDDGLLAALQD